MRPERKCRLTQVDDEKMTQISPRAHEFNFMGGEISDDIELDDGIDDDGIDDIEHDGIDDIEHDGDDDGDGDDDDEIQRGDDDDDDDEIEYDDTGIVLDFEKNLYRQQKSMKGSAYVFDKTFEALTKIDYIKHESNRSYRLKKESAA